MASPALSSPASGASGPGAALSVLVIRPPAAAAPVAAKLRRRGFAPFILPLSRIAARPWQWPPRPCAAIIAASANAFLAMPPLPAGMAALPVYCVGGKTAQAARAKGLANIAYQAENAEALCRFLQQKPDKSALPAGLLLYLAGQPRRPVIEDFLAAAPVTFQLVTSYEHIRQKPTAAEQAALPPKIAYILLYSALNAADLSLLQAHISSETEILCLSPRIAAALPVAWQPQARLAKRPTEAALLALLPLRR